MVEKASLVSTACCCLGPMHRHSSCLPSANSGPRSTVLQGVLCAKTPGCGKNGSVYSVARCCTWLGSSAGCPLICAQALTGGVWIGCLELLVWRGHLAKGQLLPRHGFEPLAVGTSLGRGESTEPLLLSLGTGGCGAIMQRGVWSVVLGVQAHLCLWCCGLWSLRGPLLDSLALSAMETG